MSPTLRLLGRREPVGARPVRVHMLGVSDRRHLVFAAAYLRRLLSATTGPIEVVVRPAPRRGGDALSVGEICRALPEDPLLSFVRRSDPRRRRTRTVLLSMDGAPVGTYLRLLGGERHRAWVVVWDSLSPVGEGQPRPRPRRASALLRAPGRTARSATDVVLTDQRWALAQRDRAARLGWRLNDDVAAEFRRVVRRSGTPRRAAVYLAEPWPTDPIAQDDLVATVTALAHACEAAGLSFQVRPAVAADAEHFADWPLIAGGGPAELDATVVDATIVIGTPSLGLLHLAAVHDVPTLVVQRTGTAAPASRRGRRSAYDAFLPSRASATAAAPLLESLLP